MRSVCTCALLQSVLLSAVKHGQGSGVNRTVRQHIVEEQGGYCLDAARVEEQLRYDFSFIRQEQQRVAVGPGNAHVISIRRVSSDAATLRRCTCGPPLLLQRCCRRRCCCCC